MMRNWCLDYIKTIAIIGVLFYHMGILENGYLAVECFFVVSGYLFAKSNQNDFRNHSFHPIRFLSKKLLSFLPLILAAGIISLLVGYFYMLPDDFENLSESVIASSLFSNNILQCITTKNYWDIVNTYKPLMHTWYIAVLFQSLIFLSLLIWIVNKITKRDVSIYIFRIVFLISFVLYLLPVFSDAYKFYFFPFRLYEICLGACLAGFSVVPNKIQSRFVSTLSIAILAVILFSGWDIPGTVAVISTLLLTSLIVLSHSKTEENYELSEKENRFLSLPGRYSYDIYIWHQVVIAFLYYIIFQKASFLFVILVISATAFLSFLSIMIRKRFMHKIQLRKKAIVCCLIAIPLLLLSFRVYSRAGVVRNIPELEIDVNNVHRGMHAEFVDVPYSWDNDFINENKIHVLVLGDSYARDFANILNESSIRSSIELSYHFNLDMADELDRVEEADYIFYCSSYATGLWWVPDVIDSLPQEKLYVVGSKIFGASNGIIYAKRNSNSYYEQTSALDYELILMNRALHGAYGDHFIDLLSPVMEGNRIKVFTDDHYFISQDCRHLTKKGAQYYARILNLDFIR